MFVLKFNLNKVIAGYVSKLYKSKPKGLLKDTRGKQITHYSILQSLAADFSEEHTDPGTVGWNF